jgi:hypothetical protein
MLMATRRFIDTVLPLKSHLPDDLTVTVLAGLRFCDVKLLAFLKQELAFNYIIRVRNKESRQIAVERNIQKKSGLEHQVTRGN